MRLAIAPAAIADHPRHVLLFAATAGLLLAPLGPTVTLAAAAVAAAAVLATRVVARPSAPDESQPIERAVDGPSQNNESAPSPRAGASLLIAIAAAAAVLIGALVADLRIAALDGGPLSRMHGRSLPHARCCSSPSVSGR